MSPLDPPRRRATDGPGSEYDRGREAGRVDQILHEHGGRLEKINGSISESAVALATLAVEVRTLSEEARLREERVSVAAKTLATETERRRSELADVAATGDRTFSRRERFLAGGMGLAFLGLGILAAFGDVTTP